MFLNVQITVRALANLPQSLDRYLSTLLLTRRSTPFRNMPSHSGKLALDVSPSNKEKHAFLKHAKTLGQAGIRCDDCELDSHSHHI